MAEDRKQWKQLQEWETRDDKQRWWWWRVANSSNPMYPIIYPKYAILIPTFYMTKPSLTSSLVILSCHLTLDMYLKILWLQQASSPSSLSISAQVSAAYSNAGLTHAQ